MVSSKRMGGYFTSSGPGAGAESPAYGLEEVTEEINGMGSGDSTSSGNSTIILPEYKDWVLEYLGS
jgi:hypothetical protein